MTTAPHWLVQSYATFDSSQQNQALAWTYDNLDGEALKNAYRFARYYRPAMNRNNQFVVDQIGLKVQQQNGGSMAGYANYAPAMSGYSMGAYMPTMGQMPWDAATDAAIAKDSTQSFEDWEKGQQQQASQQQSSGGGSGVWGALSNIFSSSADLLKTHMQNQPGSQPSPGGVTPGMWGTTAAQQAAIWGNAAGATGVVAKPIVPTSTTPKWLMPLAIAAGVGVLAVVALKK